MRSLLRGRLLGRFVLVVGVACVSGCSDSANGGSEGGGPVCDPPQFEVTVDAENVIPAPDGYTDLGGGVREIHRGVYMVPGFSNTFLVTTEEGSVVIDTSISLTAAAHEQALRPYVVEPLRYIILTHAHADHVGGVALWRGDDPGVEVLAQREQVDFLHYERRFDGVFRYRNSAQFSRLLNLPPLPFNAPDAPVVNDGGQPPATILFEEFFEFRLGDLTFQVVHTPGETPDHASVWIPELRMAFPGDNYYISFPNLYTLRGTEPRKALEYIASLDEVTSWKPAVVAPSHGDPVYGEAHARDRLTAYRDAISYVHDETVRGINAGIDIFTLMQEITLPPALQSPDTNEVYGRIDWSVRGIYDGYIGWFDGNVSNVTATPPTAIYADLVEMAGGADAVAERASELSDAGDHARALHMTDVALAAEPANTIALEARAASLEALLDVAENSNMQGWLFAALREVEAKLAEQ